MSSLAVKAPCRYNGYLVHTYNIMLFACVLAGSVADPEAGSASIVELASRNVSAVGWIYVLHFLLSLSERIAHGLQQC